MTPNYRDVPKSLLPKRYECSTRTIQRRREIFGHDTSDKSLLIPYSEVLDLDDWWVAVNRSWGLGWTERQFITRVINQRLTNPKFSLTTYLESNPISGYLSTTSLLKDKGLGYKLNELDRNTNITIDVIAL